jgi:hypothetical protein
VRTRSFVSLCLIITLSLSVWSQSQADYPAIARQTNLLEGEQAAKARSKVQKRGIGKQSRVRVLLSDGAELKGYISRVDETSFVITDKKTGNGTTISYSEVKEVKRQGLSKPVKILIVCGIVVGALIGMAAALACSSEGGPHC